MNRLFFTLTFLISVFFIKAQFGNIVDVSNSLRPAVVSVSDLNNDGLKDIIVAEDADLIWMENQGSGYLHHIIIPDSFSTALKYIKTIETGDFDNNGFNDIIFSEYNAVGSIKKTSILFNNNGIFNQTVLDNIDPQTINIDDLDSDGDLDIITTDFNDNFMYINDGIGNFLKTTFEYSNFYRMRESRIANLDGDSLLDLVVFERPSNNSYQGFIVYLDIAVNQTGYQIGNFGFCKNLAVKDINNDSKPDIVFMINNNLCTYYNIDSLNWSSMDTLYQFTGSFVEYDNNLWIKDFRNDGVNEIVFYQNNKLHQLIFNGSIYEEFELDSSLSYSDLTPNFIDMNGDGFLDIVSCGGSKGSGTGNHYYDKNHISVLESLPSSNFNRNIIYNSDADAPSSVSSVDIDNDGDKEVLVTLMDKQVYYENIGGNNFSNSQSLLFEGKYTDVFANDFNGDSLIDFIVRNLDSDSLNVIYFENTGNNTFNKSVVALPDSGIAFTLHYVDYDVDGDIDICMNNGYNFYIIPNLGGGAFGSKSLIYNKTAVYWDIEFSDFTGNGYPDLIYTYAYSFDRNVAYVPNNLGVFGSENIITTALYGNGPSSLQIDAIIDYDHDGDLDLFVHDIDEVGWILNEIAYPILYLDTTNNVKVESVLDIDGDNDIDYIYQSPSGIDFILAINDNGIYNHIVLAQDDLYPPRNFYFGNFNNSLEDLICYGFNDFVGFMKNKSNQLGKVDGYTFYDENQNKILDSTEIGLSWFNSIISPQGLYSFSNNNGYYSHILDSGIYQLSTINNSQWNLTTDSITYNLDLGNNLNYDSLNFGFYPDTIVTIINPDLIGGFPRCNSIINYWLDFRNEGTTIPSGVVHLQLNDSIVFISAAISPDSIIGKNLYWHYDSLFYFSSEMITIQVQTPSFNAIGDTLTSFLTVHQMIGNNIVFTEIDTLNQILVCAYDPNDKIANPNGIDSLGFISANTNHIEYTVRFQNTGNDTAISVNILDQLDSNLIWSSFNPIASSHAVEININQNGEVRFNFENILLPDSGVNFLGSQGFVKYKIDLKTGLTSGERIINKAHIYFDQNPAITTNTKVNTIYDCNDALQFAISNLIACENDSIFGNITDNLSNTSFNWDIPNVYNSTSVHFNWLTDTSGIFNLSISTANSICIKDTTISLVISPTFFTNQNISICQGDSLLLEGLYQTTNGIYVDSFQTINSCDSLLYTSLTVNSLPNVSLASFDPDTLCETDSLVTLPTGSPSGGIYIGDGIIGGGFDPSTAGFGTHNIIYTYYDSNSCTNSDTTVVTVEICNSINNISTDFKISIYPNPSFGQFTIEKPSDLNKKVQIKLIDANSKLILEKVISLNEKKTEIDIRNYSKGIYYLHLIINEEHFVKKLFNI